MVLAVPVPANGVAGVDISAAFWNAQVRDTANFLIATPHCVMYQTVAQTLTTGIVTPITFDTNEVDSYSGHSTVTNPSRYVAQVAGWYQCSGLAAYVANATNYRFAGWHKNGAAIIGSSSLLNNNGAGFNTCVPSPTRKIFLAVGDYVELCGQQGSGGNLNTAVASDQSSMATITWLHS